jgi:hypothetical protein
MSVVITVVAFAVGVVVGHNFYTPFMTGVKSLVAKVKGWFTKKPAVVGDEANSEKIK